MTSAWRIEPGFARLHAAGVEQDAAQVRFPGDDAVIGLIHPRDLTVPEPVRFVGRLDLVDQTDLPVVLPSWPILSRRMLAVLEGLGPFAHRTFDVVFEDGEGGRRAGTFAAVQLLDPLDVFDADASEFTPHPRLAGRVRRARRAILRAPPGGFPPLFRLLANPSPLVCSDAARGALEAAGIRGVEFVDLAERGF